MALMGVACQGACTTDSSRPATPPVPAHADPDEMAEKPAPEASRTGAKLSEMPAEPLELPWSPAQLAQSRSLGQPPVGRLEGGLQLPDELPGLRRHPNKHPEAGYGTAELVTGLARAGAALVAEFGADTWTVIGDLSMQGGGDIVGHGSHQSGRDVDVMFHLLDAEDQPFPGHPIPLDLEGRGTDYRDLTTAADDIAVRIDLPRTWSFVAALLADPELHVQRILVAEHLRNMLLKYARGRGAASEIVEIFEAVTCQPKFPHDDHMHIRVFCSPEDRTAGCEDLWPIYPWHVSHLRAAGVEGEIEAAEVTRRKKPAAVTSHAKARAKAEKSGPLHADVVDFLERRRAWQNPPHPGRPYCK